MTEPKTINRYSEIRMLQEMIIEQCGRLPESFDTADRWMKYRCELVEFLNSALPVWTPNPAHPAVVTAEAGLGKELVLEAIDVPLHGDYDVPIHLYRRRDSTRDDMAVNGRRPAILVCPGYAQVKNNPDVIEICMAFAMRGFLAVAVEYGGTGERANRPDVSTDINNVTALADLLGGTNVGLRVYTNRAVLDYFAQREDIDATRIGITGLCQGSIISWYTAAIDDRCIAVAPLCGATTYEAIATEYVNRQGGWSGTSPYVHNILSKADVQHIIACIAPRPLFVQNNLIDKHWPLSGFGKVQRFVGKIYELLDARDRVRFQVEHGPHAFAVPFLTNIVTWFAEVFQKSRL